MWADHDSRLLSTVSVVWIMAHIHDELTVLNPVFGSSHWLSVIIVQPEASMAFAGVFGGQTVKRRRRSELPHTIR